MFRRLSSILWMMLGILGVEVIRDQVREYRRKKIKEERNEEWQQYLHHEGPRPLPRREESGP